MNCPHCETEIDEHEANRCLDAWVAEAVFERDMSPFIWIGEQICLDAPSGSPPGYPPSGIPNYSTSIAAAWEVVKETQSNEGKVAERADKMLMLLYCDPYWAATFEDLNEGWWERLTVGEKEGRADTAELAICRAALKAVYVGEE